MKMRCFVCVCEVDSLDTFPRITNRYFFRFIHNRWRAWCSQFAIQIVLDSNSWRREKTQVMFPCEISARTHSILHRFNGFFSRLLLYPLFSLRRRRRTNETMHILIKFSLRFYPPKISRLLLIQSPRRSYSLSDDYGTKCVSLFKTTTNTVTACLYKNSLTTLLRVFHSQFNKQ